MNKLIKKETELAGKKLSIETGNFAMQANRAVKVRYGDTVVLATAVSTGPNADLDYFPLMVNYSENMYASGTIKSSRFVKRMGRPTDASIVTRRLIDHAIRPLFPQDEGFKDDVQVTIEILSLDEEADPVFASMLAASAALHSSDIPWEGPMVSARVGRVGNEYVLNPTLHQLEEESELDMMVSFVGDEKRFLALEAEADIMPEEEVLGAIKFAQENIDPALNLIKEFSEEVNPGIEKYEYESQLPEEELRQAVSDFAKDDLKELVSKNLDKTEYKEGLNNILEGLYEKHEGDFKKKDMEKALKLLEKDAVRDLILEEGVRVDGRKPEDIRDLSGLVGDLPRTHGSAVFTRGLTQVMTVATLGAPSDEQLIQDYLGERSKRYIHYYRFPPFSVGETGFIGSPGGREIGHGMLAERALVPVVPNQEEFPYTIILQSNTLSSNGSSSMASTCASSMALMDAGVPIKNAVAGIGIGLVTNEDFSNYKILNDATGQEDGSGYMDFKMTGTRDGVTAIQVDIKAKGLAFDMLPEVFRRSKEARYKVLDFMETIIDKPRDTVSQYAPKTTSLQVKEDQIGMVIGGGGKTIKKIQEDTNTTVSIEDDGTVTISATNQEDIDKAREIIENMTKEVEPGEIYEGPVTGIENYGAFVEILPGKEGLLHISEINNEYVENVADHLSVGDVVKVKVLEVSKDGKYSLSMKALKNQE